MQRRSTILGVALALAACRSNQTTAPETSDHDVSPPRAQPSSEAGGGGGGATAGSAGAKMQPPAAVSSGGSGGAPAATGSSGSPGSSGASAGSAAPASPDGPKSTTPCKTPEEETFSFFLISHAALIRESGSPQGFGGNLGGISGADALCLKAALSSSPCAGNKTWRAFLSTTTEHAIDRIGTGPWHDRIGRVLANKREDLLADRPTSADPAIINDLPNEAGIPNRNPDGRGNVDNHQILTGSGIDGKLYTQPVEASAPMPPAAGRGGGRGTPGGFGSSTSCDDGWTPEKATCWNWTSVDPGGCPRVGHSWPRQGSGINWISVWNEGGCAPGATLDDRTAPDGMSVGSFGGYGGFYCFAVRP